MKLNIKNAIKYKDYLKKQNVGIEISKKKKKKPVSKDIGDIVYRMQNVYIEEEIPITDMFDKITMTTTCELPIFLQPCAEPSDKTHSHIVKFYVEPDMTIGDDVFDYIEEVNFTFRIGKLDMKIYLFDALPHLMHEKRRWLSFVELYNDPEVDDEYENIARLVLNHEFNGYFLGKSFKIKNTQTNISIRTIYEYLSDYLDSRKSDFFIT